MNRGKQFGIVVTIIVLGAVIGTLVGKILAYILPEGVVKQIFLISTTLSIGPGTIDIILLSITVGFSITLNVISLIGIGISYYLLRWWR